MAQSKPLPRCVSRTAAGDQCGRRVADGSNPPVCHVHARGVSGIAVAPDEFDGEKQLRKLARSSNEQVALRATDLLMTMQRQAASGDCDACRANAERSAESNDILERCTNKQLDEMRSLLARIREIQHIARTQPRVPVDENGRRVISTLPPPSTYNKETHHEQQQHQKPTGTATDGPAPSAKHTARRASATDSAAPIVISRDDYETLGIIEVRGHLTSVLGDDHYARIVAGEIDLLALRDERAAGLKKSVRMQQAALHLE